MLPTPRYSPDFNPIEKGGPLSLKCSVGSYENSRFALNDFSILCKWMVLAALISETAVAGFSWVKKRLVRKRPASDGAVVACMREAVSDLPSSVAAGFFAHAGLGRANDPHLASKSAEVRRLAALMVFDEL